MLGFFFVLTKLYWSCFEVMIEYDLKFRTRMNNHWSEGSA